MARVLTIEGYLLLAVAAIHFAAIPLLHRFLAATLSPQDLRLVSPPFFLNHVVVGILLIPVGLSTIYCASGCREGKRWAFVIGITNALALLGLPVILAIVMERSFFSAIPFLVAAALITIVGLSMAWPLLWARNEFQDR